MTRKEALHAGIVELEARAHRLEEAGRYTQAIHVGDAARTLQHMWDELDKEEDAYKHSGAAEPR